MAHDRVACAALLHAAGRRWGAARKAASSDQSSGGDRGGRREASHKKLARFALGRSQGGVRSHLRAGAGRSVAERGRDPVADRELQGVEGSAAAGGKPSGQGLPQTASIVRGLLRVFSRGSIGARVMTRLVGLTR